MNNNLGNKNTMAKNIKYYMKLQGILIWAINIKFDCSLSVFRLLYNQETST